MAVLDLRARAEYRGPTEFPGPVTQIEIFHIGRIEDLADTADRTEFSRIEQGATAAAIEHPCEIFAGNGLVAAHGEIFRLIAPPYSFAGLFAANPWRKENLGGRAEQIRDAIESRVQRFNEARLHYH